MADDGEWIMEFQDKAGPRLRKILIGSTHDMPRIILDKLDELREVEASQQRKGK